MQNSGITFRTYLVLESRVAVYCFTTWSLEIWVQDCLTTLTLGSLPPVISPRETGKEEFFYPRNLVCFFFFFFNSLFISICLLAFFWQAQQIIWSDIVTNKLSLDGVEEEVINKGEEIGTQVQRTGNLPPIRPSELWPSVWSGERVRCVGP